MLAAFSTKMNLVIDQVLPGGQGTSTTGNVVKDAFSQPELLAEVLVIYPVDLLKDLKRMFIALDCGIDISSEFRVLTESWLDRFYAAGLGWHRLSPYPHLLLHLLELGLEVSAAT